MDVSGQIKRGAPPPTNILPELTLSVGLMSSPGLKATAISFLLTSTFHLFI